MEDEKVTKIGQWAAVIVVLAAAVLILTLIAGLTYQTVRWLF